MRDNDRHRLRELDTLPLDPLRQASRMGVTLRKYGNSTVAVLPPSVLEGRVLVAGQATFRMLDLEARRARPVECLPPPFIDEAMGRPTMLLNRRGAG
jgi:hypothetical protein